MPDLTQSATPLERPTLTQKRSPQTPTRIGMDSPIPKIGSQARPVKLETTPINPNNRGNEEETKSSPARIVIWVVIVAALAVASYFALRNVLSGPTDNEETVEPTVTIVEEDPLEAFYDSEIKLDEEAVALQLDAAYLSESQDIGEESDSVFEVTDFLISRYDSFTRISFTPTNVEGDMNLPLINTEYISTEDATTIELVANYTVLDPELDLINGEEFLIDTDAVSSVYVESTGELEEDPMLQEGEVTEEEGSLIQSLKSFSILVTLNTPVRFVLHVSEGDEPTVFLDILEVDEVVTTISTTPVVSVTSTPLPGESILDTSYTIEALELRDGLTNNTASSGLFTEDPSSGKSFFWSQYSDAFYFYRAINKGDGGTKFPKVTARYEDNKLIVEVFNLVSRSASMEPAEPVSPYVETYKVSQSGNVLRMEFDVTSQKPYKISFKDFRGSQSVLVQIKNV